MPKIRTDAQTIKVARVLTEDPSFLTLEVSKDDSRPLTIQNGDQFVTLLFVRSEPGTGRVTAYLPWAGE